MCDPGSAASLASWRGTVEYMDIHAHTKRLQKKGRDQTSRDPWAPNIERQFNHDIYILQLERLHSGMLRDVRITTTVGTTCRKLEPLNTEHASSAAREVQTNATYGRPPFATGTPHIESFQNIRYYPATRWSFAGNKAVHYRKFPRWY